MSRLHMAQGGIGCLHRRLISLRQPARSQSETVLMKLYSFLILLDLTRTRTRVRRMVKRGAHRERLRYQLDH
jgi:hypothetical protein